jgi:hypothetical protein
MRQQSCATVSSHAGSRTLRVLSVCASDIMIVVCNDKLYAALVHSLFVLSSCVSREQISSSKIYIDDGHSLTSTDSGEQIHFPTGISSSKGYFDDHGDPRNYFVYRLSHAEIEAHHGRKQV